MVPVGSFNVLAFRVGSFARVHRRLFESLLVLAASSTLVGIAEARGVRIRGQSQLDLTARRAHSSEPVRVELLARDDAGSPLVGVWLDVVAPGGSKAAFSPCPGSRLELQHKDEGARVRLDRRGAACLLASGLPARSSLEARFSGDALFGAAEASTPVAESRALRQHLAIRFNHPPAFVSPGAQEVVLRGTLVGDDGSTIERAGLELRLVGESERVISVTHSDDLGAFRFAFEPTALGGAGRYSLKVEFAGGEAHEPATASLSITRQLEAKIEPPRPPLAAVSGDDLELMFLVTSEEGPVDGGIVSVEAGGVPLASSEVSNGRAWVAIPTDRRASGAKSVTARFAPATEQWVVGPPATVEFSLSPPDWRTRAALGLLVAVAAAALFLGWRRGRDRSPERPEERRTPGRGIHVVARTTGSGKFEGVVVDAHEQRPLRGVRLEVRAPSLEHSGVVTFVTSDSEGRFAFEVPTERAHGLELFAEARTHASERVTLPTGGTVFVALVTRRRALLDRLVRWHRRTAHRRGAVHEPTPAEVRLAHLEDPEVREWASAIEDAAFGPSDLAPERDAAIREAEPS